MIFYFTGTGNSLYAAQNVAENQNDQLVSIAKCLQKEDFNFTLKENEKIGFVFPVYFWGSPTLVEEFVKKLQLKNYKEQYIYAILICGGSIGNADNIFKRQLKKSHYNLTTTYSLFMPDNYIASFNLLTPPEKVPELLKLTDEKLIKINEHIRKGELNKTKLDKKRIGWLESFLSQPFYQYGRSTKPFHATADCTGCALCEQICPCRTIHLVDGKPVWGKECTQCLGCLHRCPVQAIQYGKKTYRIGRYVNPNCKWE